MIPPHHNQKTRNLIWRWVIGQEMFTPVNMQNRVKHEWAQIEGQKQNGKHKNPHVLWAAVHVTYQA